jgi:hypothetical protein
MAFTRNASTISGVDSLSSSKTARQLHFRNDVYRIMMKKALKSNWARDLLMNIARQGPIPQHVAFIMDGNRRFARARGMPIEQGHELGVAAIKEVTCRNPIPRSVLEAAD